MKTDETDESRKVKIWQQSISNMSWTSWG